MAESTEELLKKFLKAVCRLEPIGPGGFEGFVRDLLQESLGARFRLMKSGHQGGIDTVNEPHGNALSIGFEGKRYSSSTRLSLDGLKYKIFDAAQVHAGFDIWALATTREISATDVLALRETGEQLGLAVAVIDPSGAPDALSPIALLCASAPQTVKAHFGDDPSVVAYLDKVRENPRYHDWAILLQPLLAEEWKGQIAVILTCRAQYWQNELRQLANLIPQPQQLTVGLFSAEEVDVLLSHYGLGRDEFSNDFLNLLRIPRYCQLAIKRRNQLHESGDITPERLIYEDWKHRHESRGSNLAISDLEFRNLIAKLGQRLQTSITERASEPLATRKELLGELTKNSGKTEQDLAQTLSEIIDGHWLSPIEGKSYHYKLSGDLAPFALGLALLNDLKAAEGEGVPERMAQFFDPLRGTDHGTDILRSATTATILDLQCPKTVRELLAREWLSAQNIRTKDIDAMWKLMGENPDLFLDIVEDFWLRPEQGVYSDDVFIVGFAYAYRWPRFSETLRQRLAHWFSLYCLDSVRGQVLGYQNDDPKVRERQARTQERRRQWDVLSSQIAADLKVSLVEIEVDDNGEGANPSWLSHRAAGLLSFLPRVAFEKAFLAWAVSRAVMGSPNHFDEIAWVLRLNTIDAVEADKMITELAERLIGHGHELTLLAARYLLDALATPEAAKRAVDLPHPEDRTWGFPGTVHRLSGNSCVNEYYEYYE